MFVNELFGDEHVEKIESTLKSAGYTELGSGADASVWGKDEGSVIKILMPESGELATAEKIFLAYYKTAQKYRDNPHLVKFIDIGGKHFTKFNIDGETFYQIAVEKLKPLKSRSFEEAMVWAMSDLVSNNFSWADAYRQISNPNSTIWKFADNDEINKTKVIKTIASLDQNKLLQLQYLYLTMQLVYQIGRRQGFGWDLHTENAMQRSDGTIVITDPWYSDVLSESFVLSVAESQTAKTGIMQTDVYGSRAYHARCLEPGCDWESRRYDRIQQAQAAAKKHGETHFGKKQGVAEGLEQKMSVKDTLAYLQKVMGTASHEDWRNHIVNTNEYFVLKQVPVSSLKSDLSGLNKDNVEKYKQMDFSKAPPIVIGSNGNILDGYHRVNVAKALRVPTLKAWVGVKKQGVAEAFDQPYKLKWEKSDYGDVDALATLQDGTSLSIMFNLADKLENNWGVEFYRNNSQAATGEGDAQRVFATVLAAIGQFIKKKKPNTLFFTAVKEEDPTGSRAKLYDRLVQRYATGLGYDLKKVDYPEQTGYKLTRQEQGVTEDFGQLDELVNKQLFRQGFEDTRSYGEYTLVAKPGYMPYIPGKNSVISNFFRIEAYKGRVMVGWVNFEDKDGDLEALDLQVDQKHRRKGIATAMYDFAKDLGNTIKPSTKQTAMGKKFWAGAKDRDR